MPPKNTSFRQGQPMEIGYDLVTDFTGYQNYYTGKGDGGPWTTTEGEYLSNFMPQLPLYGDASASLSNASLSNRRYPINYRRR